MTDMGYSTFWRNYCRAMEWRHESQIEQWRAKVHALEFENKMLKDFIQQKMHHVPAVPSQAGIPTFTVQNHCMPACMDMKDVKIGSQDMDEHDDDDDAGLDCEFHLDEDTVAFYEKSMRHKLEQKQRLAEDRERDRLREKYFPSECNAHLPPRDHFNKQRSLDMGLLYGDAAPKIQGMETALQISFRRCCDRPNVRLWPNIPLKLS